MSINDPYRCICEDPKNEPQLECPAHRSRARAQTVLAQLKVAKTAQRRFNEACATARAANANTPAEVKPEDR